jgi:hypothetical protein
MKPGMKGDAIPGMPIPGIPIGGMPHMPHADMGCIIMLPAAAGTPCWLLLELLALAAGTMPGARASGHIGMPQTMP